MQMSIYIKHLSKNWSIQFGCFETEFICVFSSNVSIVFYVSFCNGKLSIYLDLANFSLIERFAAVIKLACCAVIEVNVCVAYSV